MRLKGRLRKYGEFLIEKFILFNGLVAIIVILLIFVFLLLNSFALFKGYSFLEFLGGKNWYPISEPPSFGILPLIVGSLLVTIGAVIICVPAGVISAVYISEMSPRLLKEILKPVVEILATIPSVVYGFIGLLIVSGWIRNLFQLPTGLTALAGSIMLAIMAMPTIVSISEDALTAVPRSYREASLALGATRWQTIYRVVVPAARSGIVAAVMLGLGRVVGETMVVMMVTGNSARIVLSLLQPVRTMTATIAAEMGEVEIGSLHYSALFAIGLVLFVITFVINYIADRAMRRIRGG